MTDPTPIRVEVPVCAFRPYTSREYQDTYPVPPPTSVYGMLLSLTGVPREQKALHRGAEMALAVADVPPRSLQSRVFRKLRRGGDLEDTRPDYQDLLIDLKLWVWLRRGSDQSNPPLCDSVPAALRDPRTIKTREGGLSLGESSYLIDVICIDLRPPDRLVFVRRDDRGFYSLPVWVDHLIRANSVPRRFQLSDPIPVAEGLATAWTRIGG
ncbi:MAG: type I-MYXAN CRISPR-associated protein Cas5/Cmx5/DevS [Verrucomicrobia bacterium]|nr:type I-MYXAN CRISPR-associated protein Cas5/Cmx5/DevS [Verrucomicrobiota bacterium]